MSKAIRGPLSREQMVEDMNRRAVLMETRGLKVPPAILDTRLPFINGDRQVMPGRPEEQAHGAGGRRLDG